MPYIHQDDREALAPSSERQATTPGELTYQIACLLDEYVAGNLDYQGISDVDGALAGAGREFHRQVTDKYEDQKRDLNGTVFVTTVRPIVEIRRPLVVTNPPRFADSHPVL